MKPTRSSNTDLQNKPETICGDRLERLALWVYGQYRVKLTLNLLVVYW
jgi:hypothetical protein